MRREQPGERDAVGQVIRAAFGTDGEQVAALEAALRADRCGRDGCSLVADTGDGVVGQVLITRSWLDAPRELVEVGVLSPLAVAPDHQRRAIGAALVRSALAAAADLGLPAVFLEGDPGYYPRLGFVPGGTRGFTAPSVRIPPAAFQVVTLPAHRDWMTGALVYADVFWELDCVGLRG
ncbi:N-acetyltransferase [Occultella glacieicola]|uniref:N-acetyltransferase n=1 Tax=Occultella glacieicola TaxID=2518684 RepID=A0ABY2E0H7_9MICO|nr:N-acetyltransferase [Occultella glacieicola]